MKMKKEHYNHIKNEIAKIDKKDIAHNKQFIEKEGKAHDPAMRLRWDCLWCTGLSKWLCENVYKYCNDNHIDTALKQIMIELKLV